MNNQKCFRKNAPMQKLWQYIVEWPNIPRSAPCDLTEAPVEIEVWNTKEGRWEPYIVALNRQHAEDWLLGLRGPQNSLSRYRIKKHEDTLWKTRL